MKKNNWIRAQDKAWYKQHLINAEREVSRPALVFLAYYFNKH